MRPAALVAAVGGVVAAMVLLVVVIVLPASDENDCGPRPATPATAAPGAECASTGSAVERELQPSAAGVFRCVTAHFGTQVQVVPAAAGAPGFALDVLIPDWQSPDGSALGDRITEYLQQNAAAFGIDYVGWRSRTWFPGAAGEPGEWRPQPDRGDPAGNLLDRVRVVTLDASGSPAADVALAGAVDPGRPANGGVDAGGRIVAGDQRHHPVGGSFVISDTFGSRGGAHLGVDFAAPAGTPILAAAPGRVVAAGPASGFGHWIVIDSVDGKRQMFSTVYGHMYADGVLVRVGDSVAAGQRIGSIGSDGESSGPHLHFEVVPGGRFTGGHQVDPVPWLAGAPITAGGVPAVGSTQCQNGFGTAGGNLAPGRVPDELVIWYRRAGSLCPQITPSLLAAQGQQESGFRRGLISPAGAQGLAQFLPGTARSLAPDGQPYVIDADGNGVASVWDDGDAIVGQGRYMCALAAKIDAWKAQGLVHGDTAGLSLAAYNAGEGAVLASGGMPNQVPGHYSETQPYVRNILAAEPGFRSAGGSGRFEPGDGDRGTQILTAGRQWLGNPYVFGGGGPQGPTAGGFDAAGLTAAAVYAATSGAVSLPRTPEQQWLTGSAVAGGKARPGDLVFSGFGPAGPAHVGILTDGGRMLAAQPGSGVTETALPPDARLRRVS